MFASVLMLAVLSSDAPRAMQTPAAAPKPELVLQTGQSTVSHLAFSPDGRLLASGGFYDNALHLWEVSTGFQVRRLEPTAASGDFGQLGVSAVAFGPANRLVAAGFMDGGAAALGDRDRAQGPGVRRTAWRFHYRDDLRRVRPRREVAHRKHR